MSIISIFDNSCNKSFFDIDMLKYTIWIKIHIIKIEIIKNCRFCDAIKLIIETPFHKPQCFMIPVAVSSFPYLFESTFEGICNRTLKALWGCHWVGTCSRLY